ncbi:MAG: hypothetical protein PHG05_03630 [Candidatus Nanoarchaeia archaeon]|nr:hypothetical protein [Candidatus Nanoarchaeia archaeon]
MIYVKKLGELIGSLIRNQYVHYAMKDIFILAPNPYVRFVVILKLDVVLSLENLFADLAVRKNKEKMERRVIKFTNILEEQGLKILVDL